MVAKLRDIEPFMVQSLNYVDCKMQNLRTHIDDEIKQLNEKTVDYVDDKIRNLETNEIQPIDEKLDDFKHTFA